MIKLIFNNGPYSFWYGGIYYQNVNFIPIYTDYNYGVR